MRQYEMMTIVQSDVDPTDNKKRDSLFAKLLGDQCKFIKETTTIGKKRFAYEINKQTEGVYCLLKLEASAINLADIKKQAKLMPEIVRFLLIEV